MRHATEWLEEQGITARKKMFSKNGVRWSHFLRLPYWNPHRCVAIDGMHNLFLGIVAHFIRNILGIDEKANAIREKAARSVDLEKLEDARKQITEQPTREQLLSFSKSILETLCCERDCYPDEYSDITISDLREALWVSDVWYLLFEEPC